MDQIKIRLHGCDGYKLNVRLLHQSQGTNFLLACIRSIPVLFTSRTIYIVSQHGLFHGTKKLHTDLLEKRIENRTCHTVSDKENLIPTVIETEGATGAIGVPKLEMTTGAIGVPKLEMTTGAEAEGVIETAGTKTTEEIDNLKSQLNQQYTHLKQKEDEANALYQRYWSSEDVNLTNRTGNFSKTQASELQTSNLQEDSDLGGLDNENNSAAVYRQAQEELVKLYTQPVSDDSKFKEKAMNIHNNIKANMILDSVRNNIESQIYDPDNMDRMYMCDDEDERSINAIHHPDNTIAIKQTIDNMTESANASDDEDEKKTLEQWAFVLNQEHVNPHGFKFMCLKHSIMLAMGIRKPHEYFSQMTRAEFKDFHEKYKSSIITSYLKQMTSPIVDNAISKVVDSDIIPKTIITPLHSGENNTTELEKDRTSTEQDISKCVEKIMRTYAKALVDKAINSLGNHLPIPDDQANIAASSFQLVHEDNGHKCLLQLKPSNHNETNNIWVRWDKESRRFVSHCSMEEAERSYDENKEQLCFLDEIVSTKNNKTPTQEKTFVAADYKLLPPLKSFDAKSIVNGINTSTENNYDNIKRTIRESNELLAKRLVQVESHITMVTLKLSAITARKLKQNNPTTSDLSDQNRPTELVSELDKIHNNQQSETLESMQKMGESEVEKTICSLFKKGYDLITQNLEKERRMLDNALKAVGTEGIDDPKNQRLLETLDELHLTDYQKKVNPYAHEIANTIFNQMTDCPYNPKDLKNITMDTLGSFSVSAWFYYNKEGRQWINQHSSAKKATIMTQVHVMHFVNSVLRLAYKMRSCHHDLALQWLEDNDQIEGQESIDKKSISKEWEIYSGLDDNNAAMHTVWPSVFRESDGRLMTHGVLHIPKKQLK